MIWIAPIRVSHKLRLFALVVQPAWSIHLLPFIFFHPPRFLLLSSFMKSVITPYILHPFHLCPSFSIVHFFLIFTNRLFAVPSSTTSVSCFLFYVLAPIKPWARSLLLLSCGDGDELLSGLGYVIGTLDDLLREELVIDSACWRLRRRSFATLHLQTWSARGQQFQGSADCVQSWSLRTQNKHWGQKLRSVWWNELKVERWHSLTFGKREAISVTAEWIFSEHGTKLRPGTQTVLLTKFTPVHLFKTQETNVGK